MREAPASFADHTSQPRLFRLSLTPIEREHVIASYTFELGKCHEQAIKERNLRVLADIDPLLCARVAEGLGLPTPSPSGPPASVEPSPALSQIGGTWPITGRVIGIVADPAADLDAVREVRRAVFDAGMVPLVIAPTGGTLGADGDAPIAVQRAFATARSIEFDAILLAGSPAPGKDAYGARDAKAGNGTPLSATDPRILLMLAEAYRHAKAIGGWGDSEDCLVAAGIPTNAPGVVVARDASAVQARVAELLGTHRVWERFPTADTDTI